MQTFLLINDSAKSSLKKSQRILAKYLPQLGPATYLGPLSAEGLGALRDELTGASSRYLSVACYLVKHDLQPELQFIVGSTRGFDAETGLYAHRTHTKKAALPYFSGTYTSKLLARVVRLAALTHDLGKMSRAFQEKLWRAIHKKPGAAEYIRHDAMSFFLLQRLFAGSLEGLKRLPDLTGDDLARLVDCASADELKAKFSRLLCEELERLDRVLDPRKISARAAARAKAPEEPVTPEALICGITAFLALTHHRLPGTGTHAKRSTYSYQESLDTSASAYFNPSLNDEYRACLEFSQNLFQADHDLGQQLIRAVDELQATLLELPAEFDLQAFLRLCLLHARPTLVLADHVGSAMRSKEAIPEGALLANTSLGKLPDTFEAGDPLATHIRNVVSHTRRQTQLALNLVAGQLDGFPTLSIGGQRNIDAKRAPVGPFAWQSQAFDHLRTHHSNLPAFVAVTAGTGSGKTIMSAQIMRALGSTRFTYALGLRSLTLQTGQSYQEDLGLMASDCAVVIGDAVAKKAFEAQRSASKSAKGPELEATPGSESLEQDDLIVVASQPEQPGWLETFADTHGKTSARQALDGRNVDFISAPVVVCTVDQIIGITQLRTVRKALRYRRLQSASLILDEIDNYGPSELKHLASLCFMAGYARQHLVCLSATMGQLHFESLFEAWQAGVQMNQALTGLSDTVYLATVSNVCPPVSRQVSCADGLPAALAHVREYNDQTIAAQNLRQPKVLPRVLHATARDYPAIQDEALRLHALNATPVDDRLASAGFIRMTTVKSARRLAKHLLETKDLPPDTAMSVVCYHSKYSALELSVIDRTLNTLTNRKRLKLGQEFSEHAIDSIIRPLAALHPGVKNLVIIVVTTSIIETGRDHDYDWAILEPNSHRSIIQGAGRIRRHRDGWADPRVNLSLIECPDRLLDPKGNPRSRNPVNVFSLPGPFTALAHARPGDTDEDWENAVWRAQKKLKHTEALEPHWERDSRAMGFLHHMSSDGVRSSIALQDPKTLTNPLAVMEQSVLHNALLATANNSPRSTAYDSVAARDLRHKSLYLTDWAYLEPFRGSSGLESWRVFLLSRRDAEAKLLRTHRMPVNAVGNASTTFPDPVQLACTSRSLLCLPYLAGTPKATAQEAMAAVLSGELEAYRAKGLAPYELSHLTGYTPQSWTEEAPEVWYDTLLGYNDKSADPKKGAR